MGVRPVTAEFDIAIFVRVCHIGTRMSEEKIPTLEALACISKPPAKQGFNSKCVLPYGLTTKAIKAALDDFCSFLTLINLELNKNGLPRLESFMMQANFSSLVGEFQSATIPKHCSTLVKNRYHNGHPDMVPKGLFPDDSVKHAEAGIEIKGSRYLKAWQGHNAEDCWLMVFVYSSSRPTDEGKKVAAAPFKFVEILGAQLTKDDWKFAGRKEGSRRTITASVTASGFNKMKANWIYRDPAVSPSDLTPTDPLDEDEQELEPQ